MKVDNSNITNILTLNNKAIQKIMTADILVKNDAKSILPNANNFPQILAPCSVDATK